VQPLIPPARHGGPSQFTTRRNRPLARDFERYVTRALYLLQGVSVNALSSFRAVPKLPS
jgi:hypothetical protein